MGNIVVTGSASGMGAAVASRLSKEGHRVIGIDRRDAEIVADLGTPEGRDAAIAAARKASDDTLSGVLSCAGLGPYEEPVPILHVNYFGAMAMLDGLRPALERGERPAAVGISSVGGAFEAACQSDCVAACLAGDEQGAVDLIAGTDGNTAYCTAKRALGLAIRQRAMAWGEAGVRLNAVAPGKTETPMLDALLAHPDHRPAIEALPVPLGRSAPPEELAGAICFLLGPDATYVHGQILFVDGGSEAIARADQF